MRIIVDQKAIKRNVEIAKEICNKHDISCAVIIKEFYKELFNGITDDLNVPIYGVGTDQINYILDDYRGIHKGYTISENFNGEISAESIYCIPVNSGDNREGFTPSKAAEIGESLRMRGASNIKAMLTNGCMGYDFDSRAFYRTVMSLALDGIYDISVGGSFYLGRIMDDPYAFLVGAINEIRIGEFAILGTIPYSKQELGSNSITVISNVKAVYPERNECLVDVGKAHFDIEDSMLLDESFRVQRVSSEYCILKMSTFVEVGDTVVFAPNYHSLAKLLRWKERMVLS